MNDSQPPPEDQVEAWQQAIEFFREGFRLQQEGILGKAIERYRLSLGFYPTAEAHTYLGWIYARIQLYPQAIAECQKAIELDPDFGNPYNDIGACLVELGKSDEAIPWFRKAIAALRYDASCYPYFNLGKIYEEKGEWPRAIRHFRKALELEPDYQEARAAWQALQARLN